MDLTTSLVDAAIAISALAALVWAGALPAPQAIPVRVRRRR